MGGIRTTLVLAVLGCLLALAGPTASEAGPVSLLMAPRATPVSLLMRSPATGEVPIVAWAATTTQRMDLKIDGTGRRFLSHLVVPACVAVADRAKRQSCRHGHCL